MIIDSQVHVHDADTAERPWLKSPDGPVHEWPDHVTGDEMVAAMDAVGVDGAILVSSVALYGYDASYAQSVQEAYPGRFALVKPVDPNDPAIADVISDWTDTPGSVGIRIFHWDDLPGDSNPAGVDRILREAARHDIPVNFLCWNHLDAAMHLIDRHPNTRFVIDHLGIPQPATPTVLPDPWADLPKVLELAKRSNTAIKITGACTLSRLPYPFPDIWDPLARLFDAWGFDRCLWGTDWTRAVAIVDFEHSVKPFLLTDRLSESERAMLMGGACSEVYGWSPTRSGSSNA